MSSFNAHGWLQPALLKHPANRLHRAHPTAHTDELEVDRSDIGDLEALGESDDRSVDVTEWCRDELSHQVCRAAAIFAGSADHCIVRFGDCHRVEKLLFQRWAVTHMVPEKVAGLTKDRLRDEQLPRPVIQEVGTGSVVAVPSVEGRDQNPRVAENLRHAERRIESIASTISRSWRASAMISRYRAERSPSPVLTRPTHGKRRRMRS